MKEKILEIFKKWETSAITIYGTHAVRSDLYEAVATEILNLIKTQNLIALTRDQLKDLEILTAGTSDENFQRLNQVFSDALEQRRKDANKN